MCLQCPLSIARGCATSIARREKFKRKRQQQQDVVMYNLNTCSAEDSASNTVKWGDDCKYQGENHNVDQGDTISHTTLGTLVDG